MNNKKIKYWSTVDDDDLKLAEQMANFLQTEFCLKGTDKMWSTEYFKWKLSTINPAGKGYVSLAIEKDKIVGSITLTKKRLLVDGVECIGAEIGDSYTAASIRRTGRALNLCDFENNPKSYINKSIFGRLASEIRSRAETDGVTLIYGTPNKFSYPGYIKHLNYFEMEGYINKSYFRPTTTLLIQQIPILLKIRKLFQLFERTSIKIPLFIFKFITCRSIKFDNEIPSDDELNALWDKNKPRKGFSLVRDASYWKHRYVDHPLAEYKFFCARNNGSLESILVTRIFSSSEDKKSLSIVEWMSSSEAYFSYALVVILNYYNHFEIHFFHLWAQESSSEAKSAVMSLFLLRRKAPIIIANTKLSESIKSASKNIQFYLGSSDAI